MSLNVGIDFGTSNSGVAVARGGEVRVLPLEPSYVQGCYDRDNDAYLEWDRISQDRATTEAWLDEWVYGVPDRAAYVQKLGADVLARLAPGEAFAAPVNYGLYG